MVVDILLEILLAIGRFFVNPVFYFAILMSIFLGYRRVKRERKFFNRRILWGWSEFIGLFKEGIWLSIIISFLLLLLGVTQETEVLLFITAFSIVGLIFYIFHFLSPIVLAALSIAILILMDTQNWSFELFGMTIEGINVLEGAAITVTIAAGLLLIAESVLIRKYGMQYASPILEKSKRGLKGVAFLSKKLWLLPILFLIPGDVIPNFAPWWPQFSLGNETFSLVLFPVIIGFQQMTRRSLPLYVIPKLSRTVLLLGELVIIGGLVGFFVPMVAVITLIAGAFIRLIISYVYKVRERRDVYAVSAKSQGVMIVAVLPNSPAEKMGLKTGEVIRKVNGMDVHNEMELYTALKINAAHCKLEVLDHQNELRLTQHVVYSKDHYRIGLLVAE